MKNNNIEEKDKTQDNIENAEISIIMKKEEQNANNNTTNLQDEINLNDESKINASTQQKQQQKLNQNSQQQQLPKINQNQKVGLYNNQQPQQQLTDRSSYKQQQNNNNNTYNQYTIGGTSSILNNSVNQLKLQQQFLYGNGLTSEFQSSSSLQHSISSITIPKALRFRIGDRSSAAAQLGQFVLGQKDSLSKRATSFGYGEKNKTQNLMLRNASRIPGPAKYNNYSESFVDINKGKSFGHSFKHYQKVFYPGLSKIPTTESVKDYPGPGQYQLSDEFGIEKQKYSIGSKLKINNNLSQGPPPNFYNPKPEIILSSRYKTISFGQSAKFDNSNPQARFPGPGTYQLPSIFDKFHKKY